MKWDRGWHGQESRWIDVVDAIELRDLGTLKTGDLFCCPCENTRLSPVDAVKRVKHLRQHSKYRKKADRKPCNKIRKATEKGESWKYSRVVDAIVHYLETDANDTLNIEAVEPGDSKDDADIIVTHSETIQGFDSEKSYIIVPFQNLRRSTELFNQYAPNSVAVEIHRWRDGDVDFIAYIRERVDKAYEIGSNSSLSPEFLHSSTNIPNMGVWGGQSGGLGRGLTLKVDANVDVDSDEYEVLSDIERMIDVVEEHNLWAISTPGKHRYHLKNLKFENFTALGGHHQDPSIDAMISQFDQMILEVDQKKRDSADRNVGDTNDPWNRAIDGDDAAFEEVVELTKKHLQEGREEFIRERVADGMDPDDARRFVDATIATQPPVEESVREQIEFEQRWKKANESDQKEMKDFQAILATDVSDRLTKLYHEKKVEMDDGKIVLITDYGGVEPDIPNINGIHLSLLIDAPEIDFWDEIDDDLKGKLMTKARRVYRRYTFFRGAPTIADALTDFEVNEPPKVLTDREGIAGAIENLSETEEEAFSPISKDDLFRLKYYIWADRDFNFPDGKHHSFNELIGKVYHSTDKITKKVVLNLPQPIEDLLSGEGGTSEQILDLMSKAIVNVGDSEE